jgi:hypothetical protein
MKNPRIGLAWCQILLCAAMGWTAYALTQSMPFWPVNLDLDRRLVQFQLDLVRCMFAVLPGSILWGASFPLALASVASQDGDRRLVAACAPAPWRDRRIGGRERGDGPGFGVHPCS